eukprot:TRINITY_DN71345_c0_g1_i1.p1 TRINITY_DN71345_c0_g1~~TRINITY_DN71345_c0_g1_i1.p1  ORF type:complete len:304 (+),score=101.74 TRINITY_DN71345_c0_g1_i1:84-914(+)
MPRVDPALKWKVLGVMGAIGLVLVGLMAYNLGHFNQDERDQRIHENLETVNQMVRDRTALCHQKLRDRKDNNNMERIDIKQLQQETDLLGRENELLLQTNGDLEASKQECEDDWARAVEERAKEATTKEVVQRLEFENNQLEGTIVGFNDSKKVKRQDMKEGIRALRLENKELRQRALELKKADAEEQLLRRQIEEERRALQRIDTGLGERSSTGERVRTQWGKYGKAGELFGKMEEEFDKQIRSTPAKRRDRAIERFIEEEDPDQVGPLTQGGKI